MELSATLKKERLFLAGCALPAILIRLLILCYEYVITPDGVAYAWLGRHLASGNFQEGLSPYYQPLYPVLVGLSSLIIPDLEFAGRFVSVLAGGLLVIPLYFLAKSFYGKGVAVLAACLGALFPVLIYYSTQLLTESTYTLLFTTGVLAGWQALKLSKASLFLWTGLAFGLCYLLRPEAFGFIFLLLALTLLARRFDRRTALTRVLLNAAFLLLGFFLLAAPYILYLHQQTGRWTISGKMSTHFLLLTQAKESPLPFAPPQEGEAPGQLPAPPPETSTASTEPPGATTFIVKATKALRSEYEILNLIFPPLCVLLTGAGLFRAKWTKHRLAQELYLASFMLAAIAGYALTVVDIRYLVPLLPLLLCWLANGIAEFESWLGETLSEIRGAHAAKGPKGWIIRAALVSLSVILLLPLFVYLQRGDKWDDYLGQKRAGVWIKAHAASFPTVMAENPIASFYAGGKYARLPNEDYTAVISLARQQGVEFLVIYTRYLINTRLSPLLGGQNIPPEIRLVYQYGEENFRVVVYKINPGPQVTSSAVPLN